MFIGNGATLKFHSDYSVTKKGFKLKYEFEEKASCQGQALNTAIGLQPVSFNTLEWPSKNNFVFFWCNIF